MNYGDICEGCNRKAVTYDPEGVPLCGECVKAIDPEARTADLRARLKANAHRVRSAPFPCTPPFAGIWKLADDFEEADREIGRLIGELAAAAKEPGDE